MRFLAVCTLLVGACGGRVDDSADASDDADLREGGLLDRIARDAPAPTGDGGSPYEGPWATCDFCSSDLNGGEPPGDNCVQGAEWLAIELPLPCDRFAAWLEVHSNAPALRVFADDGNERPGAEIVPATKTFPTAKGWVAIAPGIKLPKGIYWVALSGEGAPTTCAFAKSGTTTKYFGGWGSKWEGPYTNASMIRVGDCDRPK